MLYLKDTTRSTEQMFLAFLQEIDHAGYGVFGSAELFVTIQQQSKVFQTQCWSDYVAEPLEDFRCFLRLLYPFLVAS